MKRRKKPRYACTGVELVSSTMLIKVKGEVKEVERVRVRRCHEDATLIVQVTLPCVMKDLCDACYKRYHKLKIATRVLVDLRSPGKHK